MDAQRRCRRALASASGQAAIRCFKADVSARMNAPGSFELYGYQSDFARPFQNLECLGTARPLCFTTSTPNVIRATDELCEMASHH